MEKNTFRKSEVLAYLENLILDNAATDEQEELYVEYKYEGKLKKNNTYRKTIKQMERIYDYGF